MPGGYAIPNTRRFPAGRYLFKVKNMNTIEALTRRCSVEKVLSKIFGKFIGENLSLFFIQL